MEELGLTGKRILILGAGVTGRALREFCTRYGAIVSVVDERAEGALRELPRDDDFDLVIVSPGWRPDHPMVAELRSRGLEMVSEIDFAWKMKQLLAPRQRWIAVTGTNGKTTTVQMVESVFKSVGIKGIACGNVGRTVIESLSDEWEILAIELSSFQIAWSDEVRFEAIALLNISPDHIDWHGSFDSYRDAKLKLISLSAHSFINIGDATLSRVWPELLVTWGNAVVTPFHLGTPSSGEIGVVEDLIVDRALVDDPMAAEVLLEVGQLPSKAPHNVLNAIAAASLMKLMGVAGSGIAGGLKDFTMDHHRLEVVGEHAGVTWIDDSKATNPHAAMAALCAFHSVIWIAGGLAKGATMEELVRATRSRIRAAILIGSDAPLIRRALESESPGVKIVDTDPKLRGREVMDRVVILAKNLASKGDTVLLAPACASMDQFNSYAERGDHFKEAVREFVLAEGVKR